MTIIALPGAFAAAEQPTVVSLSPGSAREIWAERRAALEQGGRSSNPEGHRGSWQTRILHAAAFGFAGAARLAGIHARGRRNALSPVLVERDFTFFDLPAAFDGYRILHISDPHLDCLPELPGIARRLIAGVDVDLVAITGDIHGSPRVPVARSTMPLAELLTGLKVRGRIVAVLGNHDPASMADALEHVGITPLINESLTVERGEDRMVVTGLDDVHRFYTPAAKQALDDAPAGFRIALVHSAEIADHAAVAGFGLYLCGHTHGGQICLPNGRALFTRLRRCHFGARGEWRAGAMIGYTSNGLGVGEVPLRFNCRGEIAVITLRRGAAEN
jgi:predicted MPP superfamily phosphohydrolase